LGWSVKPVRNLARHNRGVALGLQRASGHVPFIREMCDHIVHITANEIGVQPDERKYKVETTRKLDYCDRTWEFLDRLYGLSRQDVTDFETILRKYETFPVHHYVDSIQRMMDLDLFQ
jgi:hypothetical protein